MAEPLTREEPRTKGPEYKQFFTHNELDKDMYYLDGIAAERGYRNRRILDWREGDGLYAHGERLQGVAVDPHLGAIIKITPAASPVEGIQSLPIFAYGTAYRRVGGNGEGRVYTPVPGLLGFLPREVSPFLRTSAHEDLVINGAAFLRANGMPDGTELHLIANNRTFREFRIR